MPVGSADKGVGLGAGEVMFTGDYIFQSIDWSHGVIPLPTPEDPDENYEHMGLLNSSMLNLGLTIGLNDYWNVSLSQLFVERCMEWTVLESSQHHRTECSSSDFDNSKGGYLGDTRLNFKYLDMYSYNTFIGFHATCNTPIWLPNEENDWINKA